MGESAVNSEKLKLNLVGLLVEIISLDHLVGVFIL